MVLNLPRTTAVLFGHGEDMALLLQLVNKVNGALKTRPLEGWLLASLRDVTLFDQTN